MAAVSVVRPVAVPVATFATRSERAAKQMAAQRPFPDRVAELFAVIDGALGGMKASNAGFAVTQRPAELDLQIRLGTASGDKVIRLTGDASTGMITLNSPKSGTFVYKHDPARGEWVGEADGHFLKELLTRDLIYLAKGYPDF